MATRKYSPQNDGINNNEEFLKTMLGKDKELQGPAVTNNLETKPEDKKLFNIKVNASTLKNWKQFCLNNDITLTTAIKKAMRLLIKGVENGTIDL